MIRNLFFIMAFVFITANADAQTDTAKIWKTGGFASVTFNQVSLSNWTAGGENALSGTAILNLHANRTKGKSAWENSLDLGYGIMKSSTNKVRKNEDKIELNSKYGYKAFDKVFYTAMFNYRTQFNDGFKYPNDSVVVSRFNAPGYITLSLGMDYKPAEYFSVFLSPAAGRLTMVSDQRLADMGAYGVDSAQYSATGALIKHGKRVRMEFGASLSAKFQKDVVKNVNVVSKLVLFNNYTDKVVSNRKNIAVNWDAMVNIKAGKFLTTSIFANLIYDQNVISKTQFKEVIGVGASYKF